jgi:hypothetical protein
MQLSTFYESAIQSCTEKIRSVRGKINIVSLLRLLLFAGFAYTLWSFTHGFSIHLLVLAVLLAGLFIGSVTRYFRLKDEQALWEKLLFVNTNELGLLKGQPNQFPDGAARVDPEKDIYADDLDIFGPSSVFLLLNRTTTSHGTATLADLLRQTVLVPDQILERQKTITALAGQSDLRRLLTAKGLMTEGKAGNLHDLLSWLNMPSQIYQHKILRVAIAVLTVANIAAIFFWLSGNNFAPLVAGVLICRIVVAWFSKSAHAQHQTIAEKHALLEQYADILSVFSTVDASASAGLQELKSKAQAAHTAIRQLSRLTSFFEQQHNLFVSAILNSLAYYNLQCMIALERWKMRYKADYPAWIDAVGAIECFNSLATFAFNNPEYIYPSPVEGGDGLHLVTTGLAHPLIPPSRRVANDFSIGRSERLILVTGSNMSGKTTFLRTIGVNLLLAQCGAPVCATSFIFTPMRLLTSLRISDSLQEQTSYFMAELKKLQRIVLRLRTGEPALVLIDEILRGTNSEDKTYGSEQFARKLTGYHCLSLFATHDLTLGQLEQECPGVIANYCFESVIEGDDLHFNYRLQQGIARNRNASFLMKKMDII